MEGGKNNMKKMKLQEQAIFSRIEKEYLCERPQEIKKVSDGQVASG